jgi:hypothetical protein
MQYGWLQDKKGERGKGAGHQLSGFQPFKILFDIACSM